MFTLKIYSDDPAMLSDKELAKIGFDALCLLWMV
jgi:hypothetical protein